MKDAKAVLPLALIFLRGRSRALPERSPPAVRLDVQQKEGDHGGTLGSPVLSRDC
jgi:hypothetical protein